MTAKAIFFLMIIVGVAITLSVSIHNVWVAQEEVNKANRELEQANAGVDKSMAELNRQIDEILQNPDIR